MQESLVIQLIFMLAAAGSGKLDERELSRKIRNGNHRAFKQFFDAHHDALFRFLMSKGISREDAEDLVQRAFVMIWEKRDGIDPEKSLRAYLFRIAYTRMLNHIRDNEKYDTEATLPVSENQITPEDVTQNRELLDAVQKAISEMPERRRMVFDLCFMQEFTYKEAARSMDVSVKTIENHMGLALKDIRAALSSFKS
ncbi:MAG: RNA polymerase sigma-70 factor [Balneolaceae bacterium]|nr:RNA polymerase sigma-70 factor [Balneolaceae bacterium]